MGLLTNYSARVAATGIGSKEGLLKRSKDELRYEFEKVINVHWLSAIEPDGTILQKRIHTYREQNKVDRILTHPDEFMKDGTVLLDLLGFDWIVIRCYWRGEVMQVADVMQLRHRIKWMLNGQVIETRCDVISEPSIRGITNNPYFSIPDNMIYVMMQADEHTKQMNRDKRIMVLNVPYKVTKVDKTSFNDVLIVHLMEDVLTPADTDEICDYIAPVTVLPTRISGVEEIPSDRYRPYIFLVNEVAEVAPIVWTLSNTTDFSLELDGQDVKVYANGPVGSTTTLTATSINGTANISLKIRSLM